MKRNLIFIIVIIPLIFNSCRKDFKFEDFDYTTYNRVVGPKGDTLNFYANYDDDSRNEIIATLKIPKGALDSLMVFNMYLFENYELATLMEDGFAKFGSKLIYFIPFYESEGYHEREQMELNYHLSVQFNKPITIDYYPLANYSDLVLKNWQEVELYYNFYKTTNRSYKVYRIKIPKIDEWGADNNIFVNWNRQGYANGYDPTDISYIVNGRWSASVPWGSGETSMDNWELVGSFTLDTQQDKVSFQITSTDYLYVIARDIYLSTIPLPLTTLINGDTAINDLSIKRASFDETNYKVYFSNNTVAVFSNYMTLESIIVNGLSFNNLPLSARTTLNATYKPYDVKKVTMVTRYGVKTYEVLLEEGYKLTFSDVGSLLSVYQFGYDPQSLSTTIKDYITTTFRGQVINNVIMEDIGNSIKYTIYLSSNIKVIFYGDIYNQRIYCRLNSDQLPQSIRSNIISRFPDAIYSEINYTEGPESNYYDIYLIGNRYFNFTSEGTLRQFEFKNLSEDDLPAPVRATLNSNYSGEPITNIWHYFYDYGSGESAEYYKIYFVNQTIGSISIRPDGTRG